MSCMERPVDSQSFSLPPSIPTPEHHNQQRQDMNVTQKRTLHISWHYTEILYDHIKAVVDYYDGACKKYFSGIITIGWTKVNDILTRDLLITDGRTDRQTDRQAPEAPTSRVITPVLQTAKALEQDLQDLPPCPWHVVVKISKDSWVGRVEQPKTTGMSGSKRGNTGLLPCN